VGIDGGPRRLRRSGIGEGVVPWRGIEEKGAFCGGVTMQAIVSQFMPVLSVLFGMACQEA
jgi:hypothetical protein